ncbi:MAG: cation:dicarboxylase symporter family transporter, partial [candidate division Zixibacteria bacterium]|nr:cation:dicarboxylase symporter family transporter [candidate division Zixibacteria bacterium]
MNNKIGQILLPATFLGVILGIMGGYFFGDIFISMKFLGVIFLNALKVISIPLVITSVIIGVASLGEIPKMEKTIGKTLIYFLITTGIAAFIGLLLVNIIRPGMGIEGFTGSIPDAVFQSNERGLSDILSNWVPSSLPAAALAGQYIGLVICFLVFGWALTTFTGGRVALDFFEAINKAIMRIITPLLYAAPIGIFFLIGGIVAENRDSFGELFSGLGLYTLTIIIGLLIQATIILPLILKKYGKKKPFELFLNMGQALSAAFATGSSSAALPLTMDAVINKAAIDRRSGFLVLPIGTALNIGATALYQTIAAIFIAQLYGINLSIGQQIIIFITAILAPIGTAGIPYSGIAASALIFSSVGLPLEGIGLILTIDWFIDRCRATVNIWGDAIGAAVIGEAFAIKGQPRPPLGTRTEPFRPSPRTEPRPPLGEKPFRAQRYDNSRDNRDRGPRRQDYQKRDHKPDGPRYSPERKPRPQP